MNKKGFLGDWVLTTIFIIMIVFLIFIAVITPLYHFAYYQLKLDKECLKQKGQQICEDVGYYDGYVIPYEELLGFKFKLYAECKKSERNVETTKLKFLESELKECKK